MNDEDITILQKALYKLEQHILRTKVLSFIVFVVGAILSVLDFITVGAILFMISYLILFVDIIRT